jgi:hypothetical protein
MSFPIMAYDHMRRISKQSLTHFDMGNIAGQILADFDVAQLENFVLENSLLP